jgi:8-oxo-dGTP diphosphatase
MTTVDGLWFLADEAAQRATQAYHRAISAHGEGHLQRTDETYVHRDRFRTLAERIQCCGAPYGAHTLVHRDCGDLLLVRHDGVDKWVLPGDGVEDQESFREAAERELHEEAGIEARYDGLAMLNRVEITCGSCETWGVLPVFAARAETTDPSVQDPDDEISEARWFDPTALPLDTRDREDVRQASRAVARSGGRR